jgi:hypothetical protein
MIAAAADHTQLTAKVTFAVSASIP